MKNPILYLCFAASLILNYAVISSIDRLDEENITLKQLYNIQKEILENNIPKHELDSIYHQYYYDYLNSYYQENY